MKVTRNFAFASLASILMLALVSCGGTGTAEIDTTANTAAPAEEAESVIDEAIRRTKDGTNKYTLNGDGILTLGDRGLKYNTEDGYYCFETYSLAAVAADRPENKDSTPVEFDWGACVPLSAPEKD